jgi:hypothetical protein
VTEETTGVVEPAEPEVPRERGWGKVVLATVAFLVLPLTPLLRVLVPVERTALLVAPALAGLTVAGWIAGGRPALAILWVGVAAWSVTQLAGAGLFALLQGGWTLLVAAAFGGLLVARRDPSKPFFPRALVAVGASMALALIVTIVTPSGPARVAEGVMVEAGRRAEISRTAWREMTSMTEWQDIAAKNPMADSMSKMVDRQLTELPTSARNLFPALAALEALAALALAWALYHRIGRARVGPPLSAVRDFRFNDQLVWGVVGGLALFLWPGGGIIRVIGANLLVFFGALYTIRGAGVFLWRLSPGPFGKTMLVIASLLFWNILGVLAFAAGVGDTWFDWRARPKQQKT